MCFTQPDDHFALAKYTRPRAIAARRCDFCRGTIARGERYDRADGLYDGKWTNWSTCADCEALIERVRAVELSHGCAWEEATPSDADELARWLGDLPLADRTALVGNHRKFTLLEERS